MWYHPKSIRNILSLINKVPCVARTENSNYLLLALVKGATEYLDDGVAEYEKGKKRENGTGQGQREANRRMVDRGGMDGEGRIGSQSA